MPHINVAEEGLEVTVALALKGSRWPQGHDVWIPVRARELKTPCTITLPVPHNIVAIIEEGEYSELTEAVEVVYRLHEDDFQISPPLPRPAAAPPGRDPRWVNMRYLDPGDTEVLRSNGKEMDSFKLEQNGKEIDLPALITNDDGLARVEPARVDLTSS